MNTSSALSWIETVNVGSSRQHLTPQASLVQEGSTSRWAAIVHHCSSTRGLSDVSPPRSTGWWEETVSIAWIPFSRKKGRLRYPALPILERSGFHVSPVLALYPSPDPVWIPDQVSLTSSALPTLWLVCKASQLGHRGTEGWRVSRVTSWFPSCSTCQDLTSSLNKTIKAPRLNPIFFLLLHPFVVWIRSHCVRVRLATTVC